MARADGGEGSVPARNNLVDVGLVAGIPNQPVSGRVVCMVERDRKLRHPQRGAKMAALLGDDVYVPLAHRFHELMEVGTGKSADIRRTLYAVENRAHQGISKE